MEMCYDGALVMPSNYVVMDEEEMTYVEGGKVRSTNWISYPIDIVATCIGLNASAIMGCAAVGIAKLAVKKWAQIASHKIITNLLGAAGVTAITSIITKASGNNKVLSLMIQCTSFGGIIGLMCDVNDGKINGKFNSPI